MAGADVTLAVIEPLAGAGFAMSLAYLALDRFRYRTQIEAASRTALEKYDSEGDGTPDLPPSLLGNETVNELKWLCRKNCNGYVPKGWQITLYRCFFRRHTDVFAIVALGALSAFALSSGVALNLSRWAWFNGINNPVGAAIFFYFCLCALVVPPLLIWVGRYLSKWGAQRAIELDEQIAGIMKIRAGQTQEPVLPQT
jgi:hypothetical protein